MSENITDKNKQKYLYRPDINYKDTYNSDADINRNNTDNTQNIEEENNNIIDDINNSFNKVVNIVPSLPIQLQTCINNVFKPVLDDWSTINNNQYPPSIPYPNRVIITPGDNIDRITPDDYYIKPIPPDDPPIKDKDYDINDYEINNDGIWDLDIPINIKFEKENKEEIIKKEYIKNIADLYGYYVDRLRDIVYHYYSEIIITTYSKKKTDKGLVSKDANDLVFLFGPITNNCSIVEKDSKHLFDASLAMSEKSKTKLHFMENTFPVEQSMLHLKNFKTVYLLRLRYSTIDTTDGKDKTNAMSDNILKGMKISYEQKYDVAYTNLYKYLNSSLDILEDVLNTELAGLKARRTLIEKGGIDI